MSNVQFDNPFAGAPQSSQREEAHRGIIGFLINHGIVKSVVQANIAMLVFVALAIAFIIYSITGGNNAKNIRPVSEVINKPQFLPR